MTLAAQLVTTATDEWNRWGCSVVRLHGDKAIGGTETVPPYVSYVNDYWKVVGEPTWNGNTPQPWSAAFISFCFKQAGAGAGFPYATGHVDYCGAILRHPQTYPKLALADPATTAVRPGDLLWAARSGKGCTTPPVGYAAAIAALHAGEWFCSHCDVVVEVRAGEVDVIGGNVSDSVTKTTYAAAGGVIKDGRREWLAVVRNDL